MPAPTARFASSMRAGVARRSSLLTATTWASRAGSGSWSRRPWGTHTYARADARGRVARTSLWCHYSALRVTRARFLVTAVTQIRDRLRRACDGSQNLMRALRPERCPRLILFVLTYIIHGQKDFMVSTFGAGVRCGYRESMRAHCSRVSRVATRHPMAALGATLVVTHADLRYEVVK